LTAATETKPSQPGEAENLTTDQRKARSVQTTKGKMIMIASKSGRPVISVPAVLYSVDEAAVALRLSKSVLYELIRSGRLRTVKAGRRRLVPVAALAEYVASLESGAA
jgi:excisionase family DNA binding protein